MKKCKHDDAGFEIPDPTPVAVPVGFRREPTIQEMIAQFVRSEQLRQHAQQAGFETLEEADDFDVDEDPEMVTPHEIVDMQEERPISDIDSLSEVLDEQKGVEPPDVQRAPLASGRGKADARKVRGGGKERGRSDTPAERGAKGAKEKSDGGDQGDSEEG